MNPYGTRNAGPFATTFGQLQGAQSFGGDRILAGAPGSDLRASMGPGALGGGFQSNFANDRMMGGIPLNVGYRGQQQIGDIRQLSEEQLR